MAVLSGPLTRRQRARITRGVQYLLFAAGILLLASLADWGQIRRAFFDLEVVDAIFPEILTTYLVNTVTYTAAAFAFGLVLGLVLALMRLSSVAPYRWLGDGLDRASPGLSDHPAAADQRADLADQGLLAGLPARPHPGGPGAGQVQPRRPEPIRQHDPHPGRRPVLPAHHSATQLRGPPARGQGRTGPVTR